MATLLLSRMCCEYSCSGSHWHSEGCGVLQWHKVPTIALGIAQSRQHHALHLECVRNENKNVFLHSDKILWIMPPFPPHKSKFLYNWLFAGSHTVLKTHNRHKLQPQQPRLKPPHCRRKQAAEKMVAGTMEAQSFVGSHVPGYAVLFPLQKLPLVDMRALLSEH